MKATRIALELKIISFITVAIVGYFFTGSLLKATGIVLTETLISIVIQIQWLKHAHKL